MKLRKINMRLENIGKLILRKKLQNIEPLSNLNLARNYSLTYYYQNKALNGKENYQELANVGEKVNVYIPYGPYTQMIPYLTRRMYENMDMLKYMK